MARRQAEHNALKAAEEEKVLQGKIAKQLAAEERIGEFGPAPRKSARQCGKTAEKVAPLCTLRHKATVPFLGCSTSSSSSSTPASSSSSSSTSSHHTPPQASSSSPPDITSAATPTGPDDSGSEEPRQQAIDDGADVEGDGDTQGGDGDGATPGGDDDGATPGGDDDGATMGGDDDDADATEEEQVKGTQPQDKPEDAFD
jgi:hypothetical protein